MNRILYSTIIVFVLSVIIGVVYFVRIEPDPLHMTNHNQSVTRPKSLPSASVTPSVTYIQPPQSYVLPQSRFVSQSFNNCGPASLSMVLSMFGKNVDQETLADRMRPYHNPAGGVDDKSIFAEEFVTYAEEQGFNALQRPNGDIELIKKLVANDIPVVVRTWLHPDEDIGHFRIVRGYDEATRTLTQDDSYQGPNLTYSYDEFLAMWQPFNYGYILVYPPEKQPLVEAILGDQIEEKHAYTHSITRANKELQACEANATSCAYPYFNISSASYYLGNYQDSVNSYEKAASGLPPRMLWYQIEPILAYQRVGSDQTVLALTEAILTKGNQAYSELYQIRGEIFQKQGDVALAKSEFEKAVLYNINYQPAKASLQQLN